MRVTLVDLQEALRGTIFLACVVALFLLVNFFLLS